MSLCEIIAPIGITLTRDTQTAALARRLDTARPGDWTATRQQWVIPFTGSDPARAGRLSLGEQPTQRELLAAPGAASGVTPFPSLTAPAPLFPPSGAAAAAPAAGGQYETRSYIIGFDGTNGGLVNDQTYLATTPPLPWDCELVNIHIRTNVNWGTSTWWDIFLTAARYTGQLQVETDPNLLSFIKIVPGAASSILSQTGMMLPGTGPHIIHAGGPLATLRGAQGKRIGIAFHPSGGAADRVEFLLTVRELQPIAIPFVSAPSARATSPAALTPRAGATAKSAAAQNAARIRVTAPPAPPVPPPPSPCAGAAFFLEPSEVRQIKYYWVHNTTNKRTGWAYVPTAPQDLMTPPVRRVC